jgi:NAD(P)-dependent dehydrogenase (short-subunit alcohol dehydrogenase family)
MAENGSDVICADINETWARETASIVSRKGVRTLGIKADVSSSDDVREMFSRVTQDFGQLDILFNNAGIAAKKRKLHEIPLDDWYEVIRVDLTSVFLCLREGVRLMLQRKKGSIINIASILGLMGMPGRSSYAAAKAGVIALTKSAAADYGPDGIRVNVIAPGYFGGTRIGDTAKLTKDEYEQRLANMASEAALGRTGEPAELKGLAIYLASEASSFITGATFVADGGIVL